MSEIARKLIKARGDDPEKVRAAMRERTRLEMGLPERLPGMDVRYRDWTITYDPKPVPARVAGPWSFAHEDYDGPGDIRHGDAATVAEARDRIDEIESEVAA